MKNYNYKLHIARNPIIVYKLVKPLDKNRCYSPFRNLICFFNKEYTLKFLDKDLNTYIAVDKKYIVVDKQTEKIRNLRFISKYFSSFITLKALDQYLYVNYELICTMKVAICIIPKGALYNIEGRCIFSDKIIIKHIL